MQLNSSISGGNSNIIVTFSAQAGLISDGSSGNKFSHIVLSTNDKTASL
jgi:hypothetical protein